jgi:hypothetical protein
MVNYYCFQFFNKLDFENLYPSCPEDIKNKPHPKKAGKKKTENAEKRDTPEKRLHICLNDHRGSNDHGRDDKAERETIACRINLGD